MPFVIDKFNPKTELQYQKNLPYLTEVQWDISDLPFVQNKGKSSKYLEAELKASIISV